LNGNDYEISVHHLLKREIASMVMAQKRYSSCRYLIHFFSK